MNISVVIPTLNEESFIGNLLENVSSHINVKEVLIADGGSSDFTERVASGFDKVKWIKSPRGRAKQMNYAAAVATGDILLFLHADSHVDKNAIDSIPQALEEALAGSCYLSFDVNNAWLKWYSDISKFNLSLFTYGDQGLFIKKETFVSIGGFKDIPIMEDYEMVCRLKKMGSFVKLDYPIITSARRFQRYGVVRQQLLNVLLVGMYNVGVSPSFISRFYKY